jgi:hypothetical protein
VAATEKVDRKGKIPKETRRPRIQGTQTRWSNSRETAEYNHRKKEVGIRQGRKESKGKRKQEISERQKKTEKRTIAAAATEATAESQERGANAATEASVRARARGSEREKNFGFTVSLERREAPTLPSLFQT